MHTATDIFGPLGDPDYMAAESLASPATPAAPAYASTEATLQPASTPLRALVDPRGSAIFWIALAAVLGLVLVTGQLKVSAALKGKAGR